MRLPNKIMMESIIVYSHYEYEDSLCSFCVQECPVTVQSSPMRQIFWLPWMSGMAILSRKPRNGLWSSKSGPVSCC